MNIKAVSMLFHVILLPEIFLGISILYFVLHCLFLSYNHNNKFILFEKSMLFLIWLILFMVCFLLINQNFFDLQISGFNNCFLSNIFNNVSKITICITIIIFFSVIEYHVDIQKINRFEYYTIFLFGILGTFLICTSNDLLAAYLSIELQSLSFYLLASFNKSSGYSVENGLKYFILGSFSSGLFLYGSSILYGLFGTLNFTDFFDLTQDSINSNVYNSEIFQYPLILILVSLLFKLGIAPFHGWLPDVYESSPFSSAFFFAVVPKLSVFILFLKIFNYCFFNLTSFLMDLSVFFAVFSLIIGSIGGLEQRKLKSLLAYSSVSHIGYILMVFSLPNIEGFQFGFSYLLLYMLSGVSFWVILMLTVVKTTFYSKKHNKDLTDLVFLHKSNLGLAFSLIVILFSIAGFPPLIGFLLKIGLFLAAAETSYYLTSILSLFCSVISTYYYIRILKILFFENILVGKLYHPINNQIIYVLLTLVYFLVFLFVRPNLLFFVSYKAGFSFTNIFSSVGQSNNFLI